MSNMFTNNENATFATAGPSRNSPLPGGPAPTSLDPMQVTSNAELLKQAQSLRLGLASTITGAGVGNPSPASVSVPTLTASPGYSPGNKTLLGQ